MLKQTRGLQIYGGLKGRSLNANRFDPDNRMMSAVGTKRTLPPSRSMFAFGGKADIGQARLGDGVRLHLSRLMSHLMTG